MTDQTVNKEDFAKKINELQNELDSLKASTVQQISELERLRKELYNCNERLNLSIKNSPFAIIEWDADFVVNKWDGASEKIFGWNAQEILGKPLTDLQMFFEPDLPNARRILEKLKSGTETQLVSEHRNYRKDRQVIHCQWFNFVLRVEEGEKFCALSMVTDISEKKQTEFLFRESQERLAAVQEVARVGTWETDLLNFHVTWSEETYRIFELDHNQFGSSHPDFLNYVHPEDKEKANAALVESFNSQTINVLVHRIITPGGAIKFLEERWRIILNEQGRPQKALGTCREVVEREI
jgi:PAS domain S-box-containing protein